MVPVTLPYTYYVPVSQLPVEESQLHNQHSMYRNSPKRYKLSSVSGETSILISHYETISMFPTKGKIVLVLDHMCVIEIIAAYKTKSQFEVLM